MLSQAARSQLSATLAALALHLHAANRNASGGIRELSAESLVRSDKPADQTSPQGARLGGDTPKGSWWERRGYPFVFRGEYSRSFGIANSSARIIMRSGLGTESSEAYGCECFAVTERASETVIGACKRL